MKTQNQKNKKPKKKNHKIEVRLVSIISRMQRYELVAG